MEGIQGGTATDHLQKLPSSYKVLAGLVCPATQLLSCHQTVAEYVAGIL